MSVPGYRTVSEVLALIPGTVGMKVRRVWYRLTLASCGKNLFVDWMAVLRDPRTEVGDDVYIGPFCWVGRCTIGNDVLLSSHVRVTSGRHTHGIERGRLIREQEVMLERVCIGDDCWIAEGALVMADVEDGAVVGAGAVVVRPVEHFWVVAGNPAKYVRERECPDGHTTNGDRRGHTTNEENG